MPIPVIEGLVSPRSSRIPRIEKPQGFFLISLVKDLIGCYLMVEAESEEAVRGYIVHTYSKDGGQTYSLPWCSVYTYEYVMNNPLSPEHRGLIIKANCGKLYEADYR